MEQALVASKELRALMHESILPGTRILMRCDANIPWEPLSKKLDDGGPRGRIAALIPEIQELLKRKAIVALMTHWGEPYGKNDPQWSTKRMVKLFEKRLKKKVIHVPAVFGDEVREALERAPQGSVLLLENVRFWRAEERDDDAFARSLAAEFSLYINNAFGVCHRAHASVHAITRHIPSFAGELMRSEMRAFTKPIAHPLLALVGGSKIETKVRLLERLGVVAESLLLGGGVALAVQLARGDEVPGAGGTFRRKEVLTAARRVLHRFERKIVLPSDVVAHPEEERVFDIGPISRKSYIELIGKAKSVVWNGPMGIIEDEQGQEGTRALAKALRKSGVSVLVGGGDTVAFLAKEKLLPKEWHVSTGGGAMLALISGERMPGLEPLEIA